MATTKIIIPSFTVPNGTTSFGPFNIPLNAAGGTLMIDATQLLNTGVVVKMGFDISYDGGQTYPDKFEVTRRGGIAFGDGGEVINFIDITAPLPQPSNASRRIRGYITSDGGSFLSAGGTLEMS